MREDSGILRIGRAPTPAERGLRLAIEDYEFANRIGRNLFAAEARCSLREAWARWEAMAEEKRRPWLDQVVEEYRLDVDHEPEPDPEPFHPDPGDGEPFVEEEFPLQRTA